MRFALVLLLLLAPGPNVVAAEATPAGPQPPPVNQSVNQSRPAPAPPAPAPITTTPSPGLASGGLVSPFPSLDGRPQCRADCAKARYLCPSDDTGCDERWTQCLAVCAR